MVKEKSELNYYKISTFVLLGIIIIVGGIFLLNWYGNSKYESGFRAGQQNVFSQMVYNIQSEGYVSFGQNNDSVTLVPAELLKVQQEKVVLQVMDTVKSNGYVVLYNNDTQMVLVEKTN